MESRKRRKIIPVILITSLLLAVLFFGGRYFLFTKIRDKIEEQLSLLKEKGIDIKYDYMNVNVFTGKIEFYQLSVDVGKDSISGISCLIPHFLVKGVELIPFIRDRSLVINYITLQEARVTYTPGVSLFEKDSTSSKKLLLQNVSIGAIAMPSMKFILHDSTARDTVMRVSCDLEFDNIGIERQTDSLAWRKGEVRLGDFSIDLPKVFYQAHIKNVSMNLMKKTLALDSIHIRPSLGRRKFMQAYGKEIDYISGMIPYLKLTNVNWLTYPTSRLEISKILLQMQLRVFRDKRYPFIKNHTTTLPSHFLQQLPFQLTIDSILVQDSYVSYEEFPEEGDSTGIVVFDKLFATITQVHNNPEFQRPIEMKAYSRFMGAGDLNATFTFPYNTSAPYYLAGNITNLRMSSLNRMLGAAAKVKIESGTMTNLKFNFAYTLLKSSGEVELNYEDLKILSLRENKDKKQAISAIKTLLLNTFIIKKDMDEDVDRDKRTGTIGFYRDQKRSIFNYWWKSVFSGIKSAYKLDKLPVKKKGAEGEHLKRKKKESNHKS